MPNKVMAFVQYNSKDGCGLCPRQNCLITKKHRSVSVVNKFNHDSKGGKYILTQQQYYCTVVLLLDR
jgi:hypothetical protein